VESPINGIGGLDSLLPFILTNLNCAPNPSRTLRSCRLSVGLTLPEDRLNKLL